MAQVEFAELQADTEVIRLGKLNIFDIRATAINIENSDVRCTNFYIYILKSTCKIKAETHVIVFCSNPPPAVAHFICHGLVVTKL